MTREEIVAEALSWEGTPYHERSCIKGVAADCALFPFAVYKAVGGIPADVEPPLYSSTWMMHRDEEEFLGWVRRYAREIERPALQPGDFAIWKFGRTFSHGAIVIEPPLILHAVISGRAVIRANMDRDLDLSSRPVRLFTLF